MRRARKFHRSASLLSCVKAVTNLHLTHEIVKQLAGSHNLADFAKSTEYIHYVHYFAECVTETDPCVRLLFYGKYYRKVHQQTAEQEIISTSGGEYGNNSTCT